jgi:hypothetical protein
MTISRQLQVFAWTYAWFLVVASAQTAAGALHGRGQHDSVPVAALAGVEILAALLFLIPKARATATAALLAIFAIAAVLTSLSGDLPIRFAYYAATALIIVSLNGRLKQMETPIL